MTNRIYSNITTSISELKKNPSKMTHHDIVCVLNRCEPSFYCVDPVRMGELLDAEKKLNVSEVLRDSQFDKLLGLTQAIEVARNGADEDFDLFLNHLENILNGKSK